MAQIEKKKYIKHATLIVLWSFYLTIVHHFVSTNRIVFPFLSKSHTRAVVLYIINGRDYECVSVRLVLRNIHSVNYSTRYNAVVQVGEGIRINLILFKLYTNTLLKRVSF